MLELMSTSTVVHPATFVANTISVVDSNFSSTEYIDFNSSALPELSRLTNQTLDERCDPANYVNISDFNCSVDDYLFVWLGAKTQPLEEAIWVCSKYICRLLLARAKSASGSIFP